MSCALIDKKTPVACAKVALSQVKNVECKQSTVSLALWVDEASNINM